MKFYVYIHTDDAGVVFYVGKGKGKRDCDWKSRSEFWKSYVAKHCKSLPKCKIVARFESEEAAFELEKTLIATYGRRDIGTGTLVNLTDGGEGAAGLFVSEETKVRQSEAALHKFANPKMKTRYAEAQRNRFANPEQRRRASETNKNNPKVLQAAAKGAEAARGKPAWNRGVATPVEARKKQSASRRAYWESLSDEEREAKKAQLAQARAVSKANKPRVYTEEEQAARKEAKRDWKRRKRASLVADREKSIHDT